MTPAKEQEKTVDRAAAEEKEKQEKLAAEEEVKKARLAKLAEWKKKHAKPTQSNGGSGPASPQVPQTSNASASPEAGSPVTLSHSNTDTASSPPATRDSSPPKPYAGKFDPKAIAKRAAAAMERQKALGDDIVIPTKSTNQASGFKRFTDNSKAAGFSLNGKSYENGGTERVNTVLTLFKGSTKPVQSHVKLTGFGLGQSKLAEKSDKGGASRRALEDEEEIERKLEKLPDAPLNIEDAALANNHDIHNEVDEADEADAIRSDDDEAEKDRKAATKRAKEAQDERTQQDTIMSGTDEQIDVKQEPNGDVKMVVEGEEDDDDVDPWETFLNNLDAPSTEFDPLADLGKPKKKGIQVFDNEAGEGDMDAVGDNADDFLASTNKRKKKEWIKTDHSKIQYEPFRKEFYSESIELQEMTPEEVEESRAEKDNIKCRGLDVPKPIDKWSQAGFPTQILDTITEQKYESPTSIQSQALPAAMSGRDVIGVAKTGSGKTLAFLLPLLRQVKDQRPVENLEGPIGLVIAPTRELVVQIHRDCKPYAKALGLRSVCVYGGAPIKDQIAELKRGAEVVIATAGRFLDLLEANSGRVTNLRRVTYVVLDEADRMFDMGFEPQITRILNNIRPDRQTVLFSATFPRTMEALARKHLTKPVEIIVGGRSVVAPEITQIIEVREEGTKFKRTLELLGNLHDSDEDARSLIFVERQETADILMKAIFNKGYPTTSVHGGREQIDRDQAVSDFKAGIFPVMVATSVAARGLDVKQLKLVINYDSPNHIEDYVHRAGRTGRAGNTGTAVTFITADQDRFATFLIKALTDSNQPVPEELTKLKEAYDEKVKSGEAKKVNSGFGGRGIERLDAARAAERKLEKRLHKTDDDPVSDDDDDKKKTTDKKESAVDDMVAKAAGKVTDRETSKPDSILPEALSSALTNAMKIQKAATPPPVKSNDPLARVQAAAATIGNRLGKSGGTKPGVPIDNHGPDAGAFHATLEVNDFPQKARWGVTNRTNVAKVLDSTGTSITTKGIYYASGTEPGLGDQPKLYVLVEGDTERQVEAAMGELTRLLKQGTIAALEAESRQAPTGRYNVV